MSRLAITSVAAGVCAILLVLGAEPKAFAQAGSTGGTLGNTDKSAAGSRASEEPAKPRRSTRQQKKGDSTAGSMSVAGRWRWTADCDNGGHYTASFQLTQGMAGEFSSVFVGDLGTVSDGHVSNGVMSFTRTSAFYTQHWTGRLLGGGTRINGSLTGNVSCTWEGVKE
ncbi:MAG: hypothetical protein WB760_12040 [Xanthobacteraceae bacterium]